MQGSSFLFFSFPSDLEGIFKNYLSLMTYIIPFYKYKN